MKVAIVFLAAALLLPVSAHAVITFHQLDDDLFVVSHRVKVIGSRGKAQNLVYEKAASLCVAAGFEYFAILDQESNAAQEYESANASVRVRFFHEDGDERIECTKNASPEYVQQAKAKLAKRGYQPPSAAADPVGDPDVEDSRDTAEWSCTVEQITAMVKAGFSDGQIKAACPD
jgi:hypothetical protein